jgi:hypothetical protein
MTSNGSVVLLFGSHWTGASFHSYTRIYNETNNTWWNLGGVMPPSLANFSLASDQNFKGGTAILFGGENTTSGEPSNATWSFSFSHHTWQRLPMGLSPPARDDAAMAADLITNTVLLAAGWNNTTAMVASDLWALNLSSDVWTDLGNAPQMIAGHNGEFGSSLLWDGRNHFLIFGGCTIAIPTFVCSNTTYSIVLSGVSTPTFAGYQTSGPGHRAFASWAWDPAQRVAVLFGGEDMESGIATFLNDTWEFLPTHDLWVEQLPQALPSEGATHLTPSTRYLAPSAWVNETSNETLLMTGGVNPLGRVSADLWRLSPTLDITVFVNNLAGQNVSFIIGTANSSSYQWSSCTGDTGEMALDQISPGPTELFIDGTASCFSPLGPHNGPPDFRYYPYFDNFTTVPGVNSRLNIVVTPLPTLIVRTWTPVGTSGKTPLPGVSLFWNTSSNPVGVTNATGNETFELYHGAVVTIIGAKIGYSKTTVFPVGIAMTGTTFLNMTLTKLVPTNISVRVTNSSGYVMDGATVSVINATVSINEGLSTDQYGYSNFTDVQPSGVNVSVASAMNGYYANSSIHLLTPGKTIYVNETLVPWPNVVVRTWATNASTGSLTPLGNVNLTWNTLTGGEHYSLTGTTGWANVSVPDGGRTFFNATRTGYQETVIGSSVIVPHTGMVYLNLTLRPLFLNLTVFVWNKKGVALDLVMVNFTEAGGQGPWGEKSTDYAGHVTFDNALPGSVFITAIPPPGSGYYSNATTITISPGKWHTFVNMTLDALPSLDVRVLGNPPDWSYDVPLDGALVFRNTSTELGSTSYYGWLNVTDVNAGKANISASYGDYHTGYRNVVINHTGLLNVTIILRPFVGYLQVQALTPNTDVTRGSSITYVPLPDVSVNVTLAGVSNTTGSTGWVNLTVLRGNYTVSAWAEGYKAVSDLGPMFLGNVTTGFIFYPQPGADVNVLVHDRNTSLPIDNATVQIVQFNSVQGSTNALGWADFTNILPPGPYPYTPGWYPLRTYTVVVSAPGYLTNDSTHVELTFYTVIPQVLVNLTPYVVKVPVTQNNTQPGFSLVNSAEQNQWWPFLLLPIFFAVGCILVILAQRSSSGRQRSR